MSDIHALPPTNAILDALDAVTTRLDDIDQALEWLGTRLAALEGSDTIGPPLTPDTTAGEPTPQQGDPLDGGNRSTPAGAAHINEWTTLLVGLRRQQRLLEAQLSGASHGRGVRFIAAQRDLDLIKRGPPPSRPLRGDIRRADSRRRIALLEGHALDAGDVVIDYPRSGGPGAGGCLVYSRGPGAGDARIAGASTGGFVTRVSRADDTDSE